MGDVVWSLSSFSLGVGCGCREAVAGVDVFYLFVNCFSPWELLFCL